jgi:Na+-driven multidrug efflux pump
MRLGSARAGVAGSLANLAATILFQVAQTPVLIHAVGYRQYSVWLILSSVPVLVSLADLGISTAGSTAGTLEFARNRRDRANAAWRTYLRWTISSTVVVAGALTLATWLQVLPLPGQVLDSVENRSTLTALLLWALLTLLWSSCEGTLRIVGLFPVGVTGLALGRLLDCLTLVTAATISASLDVIAWSLFVTRLVGLAIFAPITHRLARDLIRQPRGASWSIKRLIVPAAGAAAFPIGVNLFAQGVILSAASTLSPPALAAFNVLRLGVGTSRQLLLAIGYGVVAELSRAYASGNIRREAGLVRKLSRTAHLASLLLGTALVLIGNQVIEILTHGQRVSLTALCLGAVAIVLDGTWLTSYARLLARNSQLLAGIASLTAALIGVVFAYLLRSDAIETYCLAMVLTALIMSGMIRLSVGHTLSRTHRLA